MARNEFLNYRIKRAPQECSVLVGRGLFYTISESLARGVNKAAIITDDRVPQRYSAGIRDALGFKRVKTEILTLESGEKGKHIDKLREYISWLSARGYGRKDAIIGVGGGVVTDVAGTLAAGLGRGAMLVNIPTTLLGMVDAGLGGKGGFDTNEGKNLYGAIYQPRFVFEDIDFLSTLDKDRIRSGMAEAIKTGVIGDRELFDYLAREVDEVLDGNLDVLERIVGACARYKMSVVERDPEEKLGLREELNFGHTIAHGMEAVSGFILDHGYAVARGMVAEAKLAGKYGFTEQDRLTRVLDSYGLPVILSNEFNDVSKLMEAMKFDKKNVTVNGVRKIKCSIPIAIGRMHPEHSVIFEEGEIREILERMVGTT